nr:hypothetical protein [Desulfobacteraceae bacterium]
MRNDNKNLHVIFNYTQSTIDYAGLVSWSMISRCGRLIFQIIKKSTKDILPKKRKQKKTQYIIKQPLPMGIYNHERLSKIEQIIKNFEQRLERLESYASNKSRIKTHPEKKRSTSKEQNALLKQILEANIHLRHA